MRNRDPYFELFTADLITEDAGDEDEELPNAIFLVERYSVHWPEYVVVGQRRNQLFLLPFPDVSLLFVISGYPWFQMPPKIFSASR